MFPNDDWDSAKEETENLTVPGNNSNSDNFDPNDVSDFKDYEATNPPDVEEADEVAKDSEGEETLDISAVFIGNVQDIISLAAQPDENDNKMVLKLNNESNLTPKSVNRDADIRLLTNTITDTESYTDNESENQIPTGKETTSADYNNPLDTICPMNNLKIICLPLVTYTANLL